MSLRERLGEGRVRDLAVEDDDVRSRDAERSERVAVRLSRRDLRPELVARELEPTGGRSRRCGRVRFRDLDADVGWSSELRDRSVRVVEWLAVKAVSVLDRGDTLSLHRARHDDRRLPRRGNGCTERLVDRSDVVPVDLDGVPPERLGARGVDVEIPADHRLAPLAEPIDVDDRREVVELEMRSVLECLPHRAFGHLAVPAEHPYAARQALQVLGGNGHPDSDGEALAERAGRDVDPRDDGRRMPLEHAVVLAVVEEVVVRDDAGGAIDRVQECRGMALREHEAVVRGALRSREVVAQVAVDEDGEEVGSGHRRGGVARLRRRAHAHRVDAELLCQIAPSLCRRHARHSTAASDAVTLARGA